MIKILCITALLLVGCGKHTAQQQSSVEQTIQTDDSTLGEYTTTLKNRKIESSWTVSVQSKYTMTYSDKTPDTYLMDGVLEADGDTAHYEQHINADGMLSELNGDYYGGRLYNTYNSVNYYEDMDFSNLKKTMLVPLDPYVFEAEDIAVIEKDKNEYTIQLQAERAKEIFLNRYDSYGLKNFDSFDVTSNAIHVSFDEEQHYIKETAVFNTTITTNGQAVNIKYESEINYLKFGETTVSISDETKQAESSYVYYKDIDTSSIQTVTTDDDSEEDTVTATFKKRLVSRLNYTKESEDVYSNKFNENESYRIDFANKTFTY
ncbi:MAG: hypothetical protein HXL59_02460, partial [Solobacterium sp.]|nr:hypothetical protein [Solobacterium sp.]